MSLAADGTITGTPTTAGTFTFTVTATDALGGTSTHSFTIIVTAALSTSRRCRRIKAHVVDARANCHTRSGLGGVTGLTQAGSTNTFTAAGVGGVPATGVTAVVLNVTSDGGSAPGFIQVFPADRGKPGDTSSLNVDHTGQTIANMVIVGVDAGGRFSVFTQSPTHVVVDVFGYFTAVPASSSGRLVTIDPVRVLDTRTGEGTGGSQGPIPAQGTVAVKMTSVIPADAAAVVMTLTADQALAPGYIQAIPTGGGTPLRASSNLNLDRAGEMMANTVISPLGSNGSVTLFTESGADLIVDVVGYFTGQSDASSTTGLFIPIAPNRVRDTRVSWRRRSDRSNVPGAVQFNSTARPTPAERGCGQPHRNRLHRIRLCPADPDGSDHPDRFDLDVEHQRCESDRCGQQHFVWRHRFDHRPQRNGHTTHLRRDRLLPLRPAVQFTSVELNSFRPSNARRSLRCWR